MLFTWTFQYDKLLLRLIELVNDFDAENKIITLKLHKNKNNDT